MSQISSRTTDDGRTVIDLGADEHHGLLRAERRRAALDALRGTGTPVALDELTEAVAAREGTEPTAEATDRIAISLHHVHLPLMADLGVLDYDPADHRVETVRDLAARLD